ncbi:hypothetical protein B2_55 [Stenotrophomonas phage B2]|nr:hypothetical protein B2_55 [Stenotrophomonas phage B2]
MRFPVISGDKTVDVRYVRKLLRRYVVHWRKRGKVSGWPNVPVQGSAFTPAELVKRHRANHRKTYRQKAWLAKAIQARKDFEDLLKRQTV